jgi:AraC-like DNA-binding protein
MRPFGRAMRTYPGISEEVIASIDNLDPDERVRVATVHELLSGAILLTGDEDLGLKAAGLIEPGDYGALEYAASTAQTAREALETIGRYMHLINDALTFRLRIEDDRAIVTLDNAVMLPRPAEAFEVAAFYIAFRHRAPEGLMQVPFEVHFMHEQPPDTSAYVRTFSEHATIRFAQPACGFSFPSAFLESSLPSSDPHLHALVRRHADLLLAELPAAASFTSRVRELVTAGLASGKTASAHVAEELHVSPRTLARRLEEEGTSFKELTEQVRRSLALRYVGQTDLAFSEIAFLLGFSQTTAFHRAFKRWASQTPLEYRSTRRG